MAILESLFSSVAIVFALVAIIYQGRELKESTEAQRTQADALLTQIQEQKKQSHALAQQLSSQENSNRIRAYSTLGLGLIPLISFDAGYSDTNFLIKIGYESTLQLTPNIKETILGVNLIAMVLTLHQRLYLKSIGINTWPLEQPARTKHVCNQTPIRPKTSVTPSRCKQRRNIPLTYH